MASDTHEIRPDHWWSADGFQATSYVACIHRTFKN